MRSLLVATALMLTGASSAVADDALENAAISFLDAWARGDKAALSGLTSEDGDLRMYGSDVSEFVAGRAAVETLFDADQRLWGGTASFVGPLRNVSSVREGSIATLFFDRTFQVGGRSLPVRFATVWRAEAGAWRLVQSSNVVPTTGQGAQDLNR